MASEPDLFLEALVPASVLERRYGEILVDALCEDASLVPEVFGNSEPLRAKFNDHDRDSLLANWRSPFLWQRKKPRTQGSVFMTQGKSVTLQHSSFLIATESGGTTQRGLVDLVKHLGARAGADWGLLHLLTDKEIERGVASDSVVALDRKHSRWRLSITTHQLKRYLPDLYWGTLFGPPYVRLFGRDRLLSAPAHLVEELAPELFYLQLSDDLADLQTSFEAVDQARQRVKEHLGSDCFFRGELGRDHRYRVPQFSFPATAPVDPRLS
jgi:hypothetical protein